MEVIKGHDTALALQVVKSLAYFDIFNYPLTSQEVFNYLPANGTAQEDVARCLDELAEKKLVFRFGDFYSLRDDEQNVRRRIRGNRQAERGLKVARKQASLIARFPYVTAVMASGSLSKGYMDEKSDLDFFIVTEPNGLWIARTLMVLYKRIFLFNSHKTFCVNYFVDTKHLEIEEKNLFTAIELVTLIPLYNRACYEDLLASNAWLRDYLPNYRERQDNEAATARQHFTRKFLEFFLHPVAPRLDRFCMRITLRRWKRLYEKKYSKKDFAIAFKTLPHVSKNHPRNFQKSILEIYEVRLEEYSRRFLQS
ncbi:MAG TPA: hypothetical protein VF490_15090 [Chryseosolibacter sp.]